MRKAFVMLKIKFNKERIAFAIRQTKPVAPVAEVFRKMELDEATFYTWEKKYVGLPIIKLRLI